MFERLRFRKFDDNQRGDTGLLGVVIAFLASLFAVIYSTEPYDVWDGLIGVVSLLVCCKYKDIFALDGLVFFIARMTVSVSIMVIFLTVLTIINCALVCKFNFSQFSIFNGEFFLACFVFVLSFFFL